MSDNVISKSFWRFVLPSVGALIVSGAYKIVEGIFVGNKVGQNGLTAMLIAWPLIGVTMGIGLMIGIGTGAAMSVEQGKYNTNKSTLYLTQSIWTSLIFSILCILMFKIGTPILLKNAMANGELYEMAKKYYGIIIFAAPIILLKMSLPFILRNINSPINANMAIAIGAIVNIILDYLFIVKLDYKLTGAAFAYIIGESTTILICLICILMKTYKLKFTIDYIKPNFEVCWDSLRVGFSGFLRFLFLCIIISLYIKYLVKYGGESYTAVYAIIGYVVTFTNFFTEGVNAGIQPLISYYHGANSPKDVSLVLKKGIKLLMAVSAIITALVVFYPEGIVSIFISSANPDNLETALIAPRAVRMNLVFIAIDGLIFTSIIYYQAIKKPRNANIISIANMIARIVSLVILPLLLGIDGVWLSTPISTAIVFAVVIFIIIKSKKISSTTY